VGSRTYGRAFIVCRQRLHNGVPLEHIIGVGKAVSAEAPRSIFRDVATSTARALRHGRARPFHLARRCGGRHGNDGGLTANDPIGRGCRCCPTAWRMAAQLRRALPRQESARAAMCFSSPSPRVMAADLRRSSPAEHVYAAPRLGRLRISPSRLQRREDVRLSSKCSSRSCSERTSRWRVSTAPVPGRCFCRPVLDRPGRHLLRAAPPVRRLDGIKYAAQRSICPAERLRPQAPANAWRLEPTKAADDNRTSRPSPCSTGNASFRRCFPDPPCAHRAIAATPYLGLVDLHSNARRRNGSRLVRCSSSKTRPWIDT